MVRPFVLLAAATLIAAGPPRTWQSAVLTETHREEREVNGNKLLPVQIYTLDVGDRVIVCSKEVLLRRVDIQVGAPVQYARISNSQIAVQDAKGKEHKLAIDQERVKAP